MVEESKEDKEIAELEAKLLLLSKRRQRTATRTQSSPIFGVST